ncbi:MAG: hypothetical protein K2X87_17750 [Gemmataceae bacterium]|nr:hypothetical protein [Gemmataceae bacterium]
MSFAVNVDPSNPGQFFACCGLLELADRLWPGGAEGWFAPGEFHIACGGTLAELLNALVSCRVEEVLRLENGIEVKRLLAPLRLTFPDPRPFVLTLDAWVTIRPEKGVVQAVANPPWNFWSGHRTPMRIWPALRGALAGQLGALYPADLADLFHHRVLLSGRFGFDPGAAWTALDVGFSPNEQGVDVASSAAVELLVG